MSTTSFTSHRGTDNPENAVEYKAARDRLEAQGWLLLGNGDFGAVYRHPDCPETVLKVGSFVYGGPEKDGWLLYTQTNQKTRSPFAPKVHAVEIYQHYYYAEMEPLQALNADTFVALGLRIYHYDGFIPERTPRPLASYLRRVERHRDGLEYRKGVKLHRDVHNGNFMVRPSTGEVVLTDPWAN